MIGKDAGTLVTFGVELNQKGGKLRLKFQLYSVLHAGAVAASLPRLPSAPSFSFLIAPGQIDPALSNAPITVHRLRFLALLLPLPHHLLSIGHCRTLRLHCTSLLLYFDPQLLPSSCPHLPDSFSYFSSPAVIVRAAHPPSLRSTQRVQTRRWWGGWIQRVWALEDSWGDEVGAASIPSKHGTQPCIEPSARSLEKFTEFLVTTSLKLPAFVFFKSLCISALAERKSRFREMGEYWPKPAAQPKFAVHAAVVRSVFVGRSRTQACIS